MSGSSVTHPIGSGGPAKISDRTRLICDPYVAQNMQMVDTFDRSVGMIGLKLNSPV
ncbi:hypothetical protein [Bradyrhizobium sp. HKCCYLS20291]|uniref:hypothetical protein n=1 Tax=Bradyrhizobium sp. HKCCYLS20291 TaxID=3420766 RepID=UPI003EC09789